MRPLSGGCCRRIRSACCRDGKPCATDCAAPGFRAKASLSFRERGMASGADADRVIADALGMYTELLVLGNNRVHAVEETFIERRKRVGRARLVEQFLRILDHYLGRQPYQNRLLVRGNELDRLEPLGHIGKYLRPGELLLELVH